MALKENSNHFSTSNQQGGSSKTDVKLAYIDNKPYQILNPDGQWRVQLMFWSPGRHPVFRNLQAR